MLFVLGIQVYVLLIKVLLRQRYGRVGIFFLEFYEALFEALGNLFGAGLSVDVVKLLGIVLEVIEFPHVDVFIEVDECVAICTYSIVALYGMLCREFMEMIIKRIAPVLGLLTSKKGEHAHTVHIFRYGNATEVEEGGSIVNVLHHLRNVATC